MIIIFTVILFVSIIMVIMGLSETSKDKSPSEKQARSGNKKLLNAFKKITGPFFSLNKKLISIQLRQGLEKKLHFINNKLTVDEFFLIKEVCSLGFFLLIPLTFNVWDILLMLVLGIAGFLIPDFWLKNQIELKKKIILRELPDIIDLLALCAEAGLSVDMGLNKIISTLKKGILKDEFAQVFYEIKIGKIKKDALKEMSKRIGLPEVSSFISAIIQADQLGVGIGKTLNALSLDMRIKYYQRVEKLALQAPIKLLFPLIVFIFPTTFLVLLGPLIINFIRVLSL